MTGKHFVRALEIHGGSFRLISSLQVGTDSGLKDPDVVNFYKSRGATRMLVVGGILILTI